MPVPDTPLSLHLPWSTLLKVLAAIALFWVWRELVWVLLLVVVAVIIAAALEPAVQWLARKGWSRPVAAGVLVAIIVATLVVFVAVSWSSLTNQARDVGTQLSTVQEQIERRLPAPVVQAIRQSPTPDASMLGPYVVSVARSLLSALTAFVLAWVLVLYLLIESELTYRWVRGFVPERFRARFDQTATEASEVARGYVIGNVTTSACAAAYVYVWLSVLNVPAALVLALIAFFADFVPVLGFFISIVPAMAMAATQSPTTALMLIPIYLAYDAIENYFLAPRVYGHRLRLTNLAVLLAFAVGAQLAGVMGALLALPIAAVYPTIERLWLRGALGEDVVQEHEAIAGEPHRRAS